MSEAFESIMRGLGEVNEMQSEKKISVDGSFKLKICETEIRLSREEAEALYSELFRALWKYQPIYRPNGFKPYPDPVIWNI